MSAVHSQSPSRAMTVKSANVEGLSGNKVSTLSELCNIQHCHCLCLQKTHRAKYQARPKIPGMTLVAERPPNKHGSSVFVRDGLKVNSISVCEEENVGFITVELSGVVVHYLYKPPPKPFLLAPLGQRIKHHIVIGDFNSHSTLWGYTTTDSDGEAVEHWADSNRLSLIHNAKLPKLFNSAIWKKGYNPDLISVHPVIVQQPTPFRRHFNLRKTKWDDFSADFDEAMEEVEPIPENYDRFIGLIHVVSRRHIPRGCRTNYIPGLTEESQSLYEAYKKQYSSNPFAEGTLEIGTKLIDTMK